MNFDTIEQLRNQFKRGDVHKIADEVSVGGVNYKLFKSSAFDATAVMQGEKDPIVIYALDRAEANVQKYDELHKDADTTGHQDRLVFAWAMKNLRVLPADVRFVHKARISALTEAEIEDDRIIGNNVDIVLQGFNGNQPISCKVDTGAHMCSLDANNVRINSKAGTVTFEFGDKKITMPSVETHAFQTADGGIENRAIVMFDVMIPNSDPEKKNKIIGKVKFNLNDRSDMPDRVLLGQNFIKQGNFVIMNDNPKGKVIEDINWDAVYEMFADVTVDDIEPLDEAVDKILKAIKTRIVENLEY